MDADPWYDPLRTYDENYTEGPFGAFMDGRRHEERGEPTHRFLGHEVYLPFGIPAGPLLNSRYMRAAFENCFDLAVYKTVRTRAYPSHPFPNVLAVHVEGDLTMDGARTSPLVADTNFVEPISITNSFGVPSQEPYVWQNDFQKAARYAKKGQVAILSFMGTAEDGLGRSALIDDYVHAAKLAGDTGASVLEVDLSCPNIGKSGLVCYDLEMTHDIGEGARSVIGSTPLILKVGYYEDDVALRRLAEVADTFGGALASINTIQATVVDRGGKQVLPGVSRKQSGICGASIAWAGLDMTRRLSHIRTEHRMDFEIIGIGGVMNVDDYRAYKDAGADAVMSATGAMWNGNLAREIKNSV